jgi:hypothetical protein
MLNLITTSKHEHEALLLVQSGSVTIEMKNEDYCVTWWTGVCPCSYYRIPSSKTKLVEFFMKGVKIRNVRTGEYVPGPLVCKNGYLTMCCGDEDSYETVLTLPFYKLRCESDDIPPLTE